MIPQAHLSLLWLVNVLPKSHLFCTHEPISFVGKRYFSDVTSFYCLAYLLTWYERAGWCVTESVMIYYENNNHQQLQYLPQQQFPPPVLHFFIPKNFNVIATFSLKFSWFLQLKASFPSELIEPIPYILWCFILT